MTTRPSRRLSIRALRIRSVPDKDSKSMNVDTKIIDEKKTAEMKALIDCGTQGTFMDEQFAKKHRLPLLWLKKEIPVSNVDETLNRMDLSNNTPNSQ